MFVVSLTRIFLGAAKHQHLHADDVLQLGDHQVVPVGSAKHMLNIYCTTWSATAGSHSLKLSMHHHKPGMR